MATSCRLAVVVTAVFFSSIPLTAHAGSAIYLGGQNGTKFNFTLFSDTTDCGLASVTPAKSPNTQYELQAVVGCVNETINCWAGVYSGGQSISQSPEDMIWSIPSVNLTVNESCSLVFTTDGDLKFVVSEMQRTLQSSSTSISIYNGVVVWSTNTSGKGAVEIQVQDNGNLVLVHEDGKSVVWQSSAAPLDLLPLAPLSSASESWRINTRILFMSVCSSALLMSLELHQLFRVYFL